MSKRLFEKRNSVFYFLLPAVLGLLAGCNVTRHVGDNQYLLKKNVIVLKSDHRILNRGELKDNLSRLVLQKPNTKTISLFPARLMLYNKRYKKLHDLPDASLPKSVERPVILDTALIQRTVQNMKSYMYNQGYFYAKIKDTFYTHHKKAYTTYTITTGINYLINKVNYNVDDSGIAKIIRETADESALQKGKEFTYSLLEDERGRITSAVRNRGYYRFTQENVNFIKGLDTLDKTLFKDVESPVEGAIHFISSAKREKKHTVDIDVFVQLADDSNAYKKYTIGKVQVFPDYKNSTDLGDTTMIRKTINNVDFKYHNEYVHSRVLYKHIYMFPGELYSQEYYDKTRAKLNELGIFQYINVLFRENHRNGDTLNCNILLNRTKQFDYSNNYELTNGSTYSLGHQIGVSVRNKNFWKGANLLSIGVNGGVELSYNDNVGKNFFQHYGLLTEYYGVNASIDFPKFLAPIAASLFDNTNLPHTIIGVGDNVIDRVNYFTLVNTSANYSYNWHETQTKTWTLSPAFINVIHLPVKTDSFQRVLDSNEYLKNSYKENFIEGENISFTFDDIVKKKGINYSYLKLSFEEAGELLNGINQLGVALNDLYKIQYAQYAKFDFDARHYFTLPYSVFAFRFSGGVGVPYGQSTALPYIKQYFAGGPYSLRGWRIRTLGPGSYYDSKTNNINQIDRTGDIKLELNGEFRFPIMPLFAGAVKLKGALFADAGNIWLAQKDNAYPGGEFQFNTLGQDIAADIGAGTRFEIASFLTIRVEIAMPVKKPYVYTNGSWVFDQIDFSNPTWRSNNLIFFGSIGYPF